MNWTDYQKRGLSKFEKNQYKEAIKDFNKAIKLNTKDFYSWKFRGISKYFLDQNEEAIKDLDKAIKLNPKDADIYLERGKAHELNGNLEEAMNDYNYAIQLNPSHIIAYYERSWLKMDTRIKDFDGAITDMRQIVILDPYNVERMLDLARINYLANKNKSAVKILTKAIQIEPENGNQYKRNLKQQFFWK